LWLGLRRKDGLCLEQLSQRLQYGIQDQWRNTFDHLASQGLLHIEGSRVSLTDEGQLFGNTVGEEFLAG
jgi:coproporphyrinogen III oxidase-like Fe-S oxidoreductase